jgi:hypothetical protein
MQRFKRFERLDQFELYVADRFSRSSERAACCAL